MLKNNVLNYLERIVVCMNLSNIITRIKLKLGLAAFSSPFININETIREIIQDITVPVFSIYNPYNDKITLRTNELELVEKNAFSEKYVLPEWKNRKLLYVFDVQYAQDSLTGLGYYGGGMPAVGEGSLLSQTMLANAGADVMNYLIPKITFDFQAPKNLTLYNIYASSKIEISLGFEHDKSLASIEESMRESFIKLALLDVKENLYPTMKQYNEMPTAIGNINLRIDNWENAENDRIELLQKWDETYHLDIGPGVYYI